ncbi:MAG: glycosyltransferase family 2 protein [Candidatus Woesebacteria bacterium]|nr:glycosyltransferase family 2 protein [Candidatus Woesebacteria bacterium]
MKNYTVSVIMPNFNGEKLLEKNLPFLLEAGENLQNHIIEIIIVDDGSGDGSAKLIASKFPQIKLIRHKTNRGFSAAVDTGVRSAKGDLMCLLNSDVIPQYNFLESVFPHFLNPKVFAVSLNEIGDFSWARGTFINGFIGHSTGPKSLTAHDTFWVSGGSGVFRRTVWMELGGMDERLLSPFYWEDVDLCYRALKRSYRLIWEPGAKVTHIHEATINRFSKKYVQRILERNQLLFIWKNLTSANLFRKHIAGLLKRLAKHPGYIRIVLMAVRRLGVLIKARHKEIKEAKISDETLFSRF